MSLPDYKALSKLASACRKAGIKSFKNAEFEFVLTDEAPQSAYKRRMLNQPKVKEAYAPASAALIETDTLTEDQLLFWSSGNVETPNESN